MSTNSLAAYSRPRSDPQSPELMALVDRARIGDMDAQSELVRRYTARLAGFVRPIVRQPEAIDDILQVVFIKMVRRLKLLRCSEAFEAWLFQLARNTALDFVRRRRCRPVTVGDDTLLENAADHGSDRAVREISEAFEIAVKRLTPIDEKLVRMVVDGHSYDTIAARSGLTVGAVKVRLCRVRPFLRCSVGGETGERATDGVVYVAPGRRAA